MILPELNKLLAYQNRRVIQDFCFQQPQLTPSQVQQQFEDLSGWMWLTVYRKLQHKKTWLFGPLLTLDELWHCFILHTRDYHAFCQQFFGEYFHHDREEHDHEYELQPEELADFLQDCFLHLGEEWVERHFAQFFISVEN